MTLVALPWHYQSAALWQGLSLNLEIGSWPQSHGDPPVSATHSAGVTGSYAVLLNFLTWVLGIRTEVLRKYPYSSASLPGFRNTFSQHDRV